jgi:hypothetical protein
MSVIREQHRQAIELAERAFEARRLGDCSEAEALFRQAFECERSAAEAVVADLAAEPTRSVLLRSAATLALDCHEYREAERLIAVALSGNLPEEIAEELRDLWEQVQFERHLDLHGTTLDPEELQLSIAGSAVGYGMTQSSAFVERIQAAEKLLLRTAERTRGQPYRERGPIKQSVRNDFDLYISVPRAASFAVTLRLGRAHDQQRLPGTQDTSDVIDEALHCLELFNNSQEDDLKHRITEEAYYRNFVGLARQMAPDGDQVKVVGLAVMRDNRVKKVALTRQPESASALSSEGVSHPQAKYTIVTGVLKFADARRGARRIEVVDERGEAHKVIVPEGMMGDIVKPLWEDVVVITGTKTPRGILLDDIRRVSGI